MAATGSLKNSSTCEGSTRFRPLFLQRVCRSALTAHDRLGFSCLQPTAAGCSQPLLDQTQMLNMQEDAYCRRISAEVMKRCLYKPAAPCRRRFRRRAPNTSEQACVMQSLPATPGDSSFTTPLISPATSYSCFSLFSCTTTPRAVSPETPDISDRGLASVLTPRPRYVHASCSQLINNDAASPDSIFLNVPSISDQFCSRKRLSASIHHL